MNHVKDLVDEFRGRKVLVVGDLMLDSYIHGDVNRINPEAPVPVLNVDRREYRLGGAANVAHNIVKLGGECTVVGRVGKDDIRDELELELKEAGIGYHFIESDSCPTIKKERIVAQNQQAIRVDWEDKTPVSEEGVEEVLDFVKKKDFDLLVVSDYAKGLVTESLMNGLDDLGVKIVADTKPSNIDWFRGVHVLTPNLKEGKEMTGEEDVEEIGSALVERLDANIVLTRGSDGVSLFEKDGKHQYLPARAKEVYDVSGAGDTLLSALALSVASGESLYESVMLANQAAGIAVGKFGTSPVSAEELKKSFGAQESKIKDRKDMKRVVEGLKAEDKKVVFTNGCFDILHSGHIKLLNEAKSFGDVLVLGLNTDESVKRLKGEDRPINHQEDRAEVLANLECVDYVVFFDEDTPVEIIKELEPDVHVKGGDYDPNDYEEMPEAEVVHSYGGEVEIVDLVEGKSTTSIIDKIKD